MLPSPLWWPEQPQITKQRWESTASFGFTEKLQVKKQRGIWKWHRLFLTLIFVLLISSITNKVILDFHFEWSLIKYTVRTTEWEFTLLVWENVYLHAIILQGEMLKAKKNDNYAIHILRPGTNRKCTVKQETHLLSGYRVPPAHSNIIQNLRQTITPDRTDRSLTALTLQSCRDPISCIRHLTPYGP